MRRPGFDARRFEQVLFESISSKAALQKLLVAGTPPPDPHAALRGLFFDTIAESAALKIDPAVWLIIDNLSSELSPESQSLSKAEPSLPSHREQMESIKAGGREWRETSKGSFEADPRDKAHAEKKFDESWRKSAEEERAREAYERARVNDPRMPWHAVERPRPRPPGRGKGVSIGDYVSVAFDRVPTAAFFVVNKKNDRFGRLFVVLKSSTGRSNEIAYSRELYADSFAAALDLINDPTLPDDTTTSYWRYLSDLDLTTKRMLIAHGATQRPLKDLLSALDVDPGLDFGFLRQFERMPIDIASAVSGSNMFEYASIGKPWFQPNSFLDSRIGAALASDMRLMDIQAFARKYPKAFLDLAIHPALVGRQVAWSVCRVDFAFLRPEWFLKDVAVLKKSGSTTLNTSSISLGDASTWEFYERAAHLSLTRQGPGRHLIVVQHPDPKRPAQSSRLWLALIKKPGKLPPTPPLGIQGDFEHMERAEELAMPAVDWLVKRHPDFVRVNDLVESCDLLRWVKLRHPPLWLVDMDGPGKAVPTPRSIRLDTGPQVARNP